MRRALAIVAVAGLGAAGLASTAAGATVLAELPPGADARDVGRDSGVALTRAFPQIGWAEYALPAAEPAAARERLLDDGRVFRLDYQRAGEEIEAQFVPNDPYTANPLRFTDNQVETDHQWELPRFYQAWDLARGSLGTRVAVVDSEIDRAHPDLAPNVVAGYNAEAQFPATYRSGDTRATPAQIADEEDLHGTHVAGSAAAATNNARGVSGAGFSAGLMPVKVTLSVPAGQGEGQFVANAVDGITWAVDNGADVINMSFGTPTPHPALADAVAYARSRDVLPVAAAGNNQDDPDALRRGVPLFPAAFPGVLAVGATDWNGNITSFSTNGVYVDAAAPGARILSTWDRAAADYIPDPGYTVLSGTSMASPIVAGLAALLRDLRPDLSIAQVEGIILATATDRGTPGRDNAYGAGLINAEAALLAAGAVMPAPPPPPPPAAAPAPIAPPPAAAPLRARARLVYRCSVGDARVPTGASTAFEVTRGRSLVCRGRTLPGLGQARIQVQRLVAGRWVRIDQLRASAAGRFGFMVPLRTTGRWTIRAAFVPTPAVAPSGGARTDVRVVRRR